jgi:hypothetical protein
MIMPERSAVLTNNLSRRRSYPKAGSCIGRVFVLSVMRMRSRVVCLISSLSVSGVEERVGFAEQQRGPSSLSTAVRDKQ